MYVELTVVDGDNTYPSLFNMERVMYFSPLIDATTRLYMNVASKDGKPHTVDVEESYEEIKQLVEGNKNAS